MRGIPRTTFHLAINDWWIPACQQLLVVTFWTPSATDGEYLPNMWLCVVPAVRKTSLGPPRECNRSSSRATRPMCPGATFRWINKRNAMFKLNQIFQWPLIRDRPLQSPLLALPYIQLNAPVTCVFSLDRTGGEVGGKGAHLHPKEMTSGGNYTLSCLHLFMKRCFIPVPSEQPPTPPPPPPPPPDPIKLGPTITNQPPP